MLLVRFASIPLIAPTSLAHQMLPVHLQASCLPVLLASCTLLQVLLITEITLITRWEYA